MGHRGYKNQNPQEIEYSVVPNREDFQQEMPPVNGLLKPDDESVRAANREREHMRDAISKRMGDLLLRGVTMLDAYCTICNGILMEDRSGKRTCVTCELYAEKECEGDPALARTIAHLGENETPALVQSSSQIVTAIPLNSNCSLNARSPPKVSKMPGTGTFSKMGQGKVEVKSLSAISSTSIPSHIYTTVIEAVGNKVEWAAERLSNTTNIDESRHLVALIGEAMALLKQL